MKKILFYTDTPFLGGAENQMLLLAKNLPRERFTVTVACSSYQSLNPWCQQLMDAGIDVQRLHVSHKHDPRHFIYLRSMLPKFDLLHLHVWNPASCRYGLVAAGRTPVVITEHDPFPLSGLKGWIKKKLMASVRDIIVASQAAKKLVLDGDASLGSRITVVPNGIDIDAWRTAAKLDSRMEYRRNHFKALGNEKIILCVAELNERKGQKYLIGAVRAITENVLNAKLIFVGDGPTRHYYEKLARPLGDRVLFLGRRRDVAQLMTAADLFVLPSIREAFGLVILEATVSGIPVVASRVGGIQEIIEDGRTGLLVPPQDEMALAKAISNILQNPGKASEFVIAGQARVDREYTARTMAERTAAVYDGNP